MNFSLTCSDGGGSGSKSTYYFIDVVSLKLLVMGQKMRGEKREECKVAWGHFPQKTSISNPIQVVAISF